HSRAPVSPTEYGRTTPAPWPERRLLREGIAERIASQVIEPAADSAYVLTSRTHTPVRGPWVLRRIDLRTGSRRRGPTVGVGGLAMAAGYLWIYGVPRASAQPVAWQVDPVTLARVRSIAFPRLPPRFAGASPVITAGPAGSVWIGYDR